MFNLDYGQLKLVFEALKERKVLLQNAPHLSHVLMIATPCYEWYEVPYYWAGMKAYDLVAGTSALTFSSFATSSRTIMEFPTVAKRKVLIDDEEEARKIRERDDVDEILSTEEPTMGKSLKGSVLYSDGQFDDARLNVALAVTAAHAGAVVLNHCSVVDLLKDDDVNREKVTGAILKDEETGKTYAVRAKVIVNCAGRFRGRCASFRRSVKSDQGEKNGLAFVGNARCVAKILRSGKVWHDHPEDERRKSRVFVAMVGPRGRWNDGYCFKTGRENAKRTVSDARRS